MRTTVDLPEDLHRIAASIARDSVRRLSETIVELLRRALDESRTVERYTDEQTSFPVIRLGGPPPTVEDVRAPR